MFVHLPHSVSKRIEAWFFRRVAPPRDEDVLSVEEFETGEEAAKVVERGMNRVQMPLAVFYGVGVACVLYSIDRVGDPTPLNAVYEQRTAFVLVALVFASILIGLSISLLTWKRFADGETLAKLDHYYRWKSMENGYDARRKSRITAWIGLILFAAAAVLFMRIGTVIDDRGLRFLDGLTVVRRSYAEIKQVGVYEEYVSQRGELRRGPNVEIRFTSGPALRLSGDRRTDPEIFNRVARVCGEKSGVAVTSGVRRPE